jgi:hypothetical protein
VVPAFKTKGFMDVDYSGTWYYIETKHGPQGITSGSGIMYSSGSPRDWEVWTSVEYSEFVDEGGVTDAAGRTADGKYWRERGMWPSSATYAEQDRETARKLDCVMDRVEITPFR